MKLLQHTYVLISLVAVIAVIPLSKISGTKNTSIPVKVSKKTGVIKDISREKATPAAYYNENDNSWLFSAQVLEIKDVSIYGRPGSIAMIEYVHEGDVHKGWAVLKIDDYAFSGSSSDITVGDHLILSDVKVLHNKDLLEGYGETHLPKVGKTIPMSASATASRKALVHVNLLK